MSEAIQLLILLMHAAPELRSLLVPIFDGSSHPNAEPFKTKLPASFDDLDDVKKLRGYVR